MSGDGNIHGTALILGGHGVLLRGPSGAGKSLLALLLIDQFRNRGQEAMLVSDDRVEITATAEGVMMHAPAAIAGMIELRGRGIVQRPHAPHARLDLVVDLVDTLERMVEEEDLVTTLAGVKIPRCPVPRAGKIEMLHQLALIGEALAMLPVKPARRKKIT